MRSKTTILNFLIFLGSLFFVLFSNSKQSCLDLFRDPEAKVTQVFSAEEFQRQKRLANRKALVSKIRTFSIPQLLGELKKTGRLMYLGNHRFEPGTEFLASNEFDWAKMPMDREETDLVIGFGTNSVWDIALRKGAKQMVIADWSPWPIISQAYIIAPLIRIAKSPQELILMISGIPPNVAKGMSIADAFDVAVDFDHQPTEVQAKHVRSLIEHLLQDASITDLELQFLANYFSPRTGAGNPNGRFGGFGPFQSLREPSMAFLNQFYADRYHPSNVGSVESVFSSESNFKYLKDRFDQNQVLFAVASVNDPVLYRTAASHMIRENFDRVTVSVSNIFDCGCYNGLTFKDFQSYLQMILSQIPVDEGITVFRTTNNQPPHGYYRYQIKTTNDVPKNDEHDSSALKRAG